MNFFIDILYHSLERMSSNLYIGQKWAGSRIGREGHSPRKTDMLIGSESQGARQAPLSAALSAGKGIYNIYASRLAET